jgi:DNA-binding transcriptional ArsR family regulator
MPPLFDEIVHKALSNELRKRILISLSKKEKYLSEIAVDVERKPQTIDFHLSLLEDIGLIKSNWVEGKKYYSLKDEKIVVFLKHRKPIPHEFRPKPPHEIVLDAWKDIVKRLDRIEKRLERIENLKK